MDESPAVDTMGYFRTVVNGILLFSVASDTIGGYQKLQTAGNHMHIFRTGYRKNCFLMGTVVFGVGMCKNADCSSFSHKTSSGTGSPLIPLCCSYPVKRDGAFVSFPLFFLVGKVNLLLCSLPFYVGREKKSECLASNLFRWNEDNNYCKSRTATHKPAMILY